MQTRTRIFNVPPTLATESPESTKRRAILFVTAVEKALPNVNSHDTRDIIQTLLKVAAELERKLIVRVHPMEPIPKYRSYVESELAALKIHVPVEYSQGEGLDHVLQQSAVAVMHASTVFLDCIRLRIPVVSFGWHEFSYKSLIEKHHVFSFAENLRNLQELTIAGVNGELRQAPEIEYFLSPTTPGELRDYFQQELDRRALRATS